MKKSRFLESLQHLQEDIPANFPREEELSFTPEENQEDFVENIPTKETQKNPYAIYLGKGVSFLSPQEAYDYLLQEEAKPLTPKYRNTLTKAFFKGTEAGKIVSLYKDWKKHKNLIFPKISEFFSYIKKEVESLPLCKRYVSHVISGLTPANGETFDNGVVDLIFFKFWVLFKFYAERLERGQKRTV